MKNCIPICFYPTRKIVLDDDSIFAESVLLKMNGRHFSSYQSPPRRQGSCEATS
jgi:hypothetical protein